MDSVINWISRTAQETWREIWTELGPFVVDATIKIFGLVIAWNLVKAFCQWALGAVGEFIIWLVETSLELLEALIGAVKEFSKAFATLLVTGEGIWNVLWSAGEMALYAALASIVIGILSFIARPFEKLIGSVKRILIGRISN